MFVHGLALPGHESATTAYAVMMLFVLQSLWLCQSVLWQSSPHHTASLVYLATAGPLKRASLCPGCSLIRLMPWVP